MKCPNDGATLVMSERSGIEIDYCPECRGVWLDRGELDKIIDRAGSGAPAAAAAAPGAPVTPPAPQVQQPPVQQPQYYDTKRGYDNRGYDNRGYDSRGYGQQPYRKKKDNWLSDLFD